MNRIRKIAAGAALAALIAGTLSSAAFADEKYRGYLAPPQGMTDVGIDTDAKAPSAMNVLAYPMNIVQASNGEYLVTDTGNHVVWAFSGSIDNLIAGNAVREDIYRQPLGGYHDGGNRESLFDEPWGIAPFAGGYAVSDANNDVIRLINYNGGNTATAVTIAAGLKHPTGLAASGDGGIFIADTLNSCIRKMDAAGNITTVLTGLLEPTGLCYAGGILYICETGAGRVLKYKDGIATVIAQDLDDPQGVAVAEDGSIYVSDTGNHRVLKLEGNTRKILLQGDPAVLGERPVSPAGLLISGSRLLICDNFLQQMIVIDR